MNLMMYLVISDAMFCINPAQLSIIYKETLTRIVNGVPMEHT